jgi:adenylate kinase
VIIAVSGTPGTGKTSACEVLEKRGYVVVDLDEVARREGLIVGRDTARGSDEVDVEGLRERLRIPSKVAFLRSHYSHRMDVNVAVILRCRPSRLRVRLEARGWPAEKVRENVEAEAIDVILQEAVEHVPFVFEVDTTKQTPAETAEDILAIVQGKTKGHEPGSVDWTSEVLSWY